MESSARQSNSSAEIIRLIRYLKKHRSRLWSAVLCSVGKKLFDITPEIVIGIAIDVVVSKEDSFLAKMGITEAWDQILLLALITFFIWAGESIFHYLYMILWRGLAQLAQHDLRMDTYSHVQDLDISYFEDTSTGNLVAIMNDDINQLERFLDVGANELIQTFTTVIGVGAIFFFLSPQIAMISILPIPVIVLGAFYFQKRATPLYNDVRRMAGNLSARLNNNLSGILTIKSFVAEASEVKRLHSESIAYLNANHEAIRVSSAFTPIIRMAILTGFLGTFILGAWQVFNGTLSVGAYGVLVFLTQRLLWPFTGLAVVVDLYERAMASTRRVLDLLETPIQIKSGTFKPSSLTGNIEFKNVDFQYASGGKVLNNLSVDIPAKKTTAIVGTTGSGKSTLIKLLLRFYEIQNGHLFIDGKDIAEFESASLRNCIGLVSQDVFLFQGTVRENLLYGKPSASEADIIQASQQAAAYDFIQALPDGFDTEIGERGQKLSGGQRQRLSLARCILKDPDILILDEATSAVDNETEAAIQNSLNILTKDRTTIVIAHRLSTIVAADSIHVLQNGTIVESGNHEELLAKETGVYSNLWRVQTGLGASEI